MDRLVGVNDWHSSFKLLESVVRAPTVRAGMLSRGQALARFDMASSAGGKEAHTLVRPVELW